MPIRFKSQVMAEQSRPLLVERLILQLRNFTRLAPKVARSAMVRIYESTFPYDWFQKGKKWKFFKENGNTFFYYVRLEV